MKLPIYKYLDISTAHITRETDEYLKWEMESEYGNLIVNKKECGYFICVPYNIDDIEMHIPTDLVKCLGLAKKHGCNWLVLDCDAEIIDELETYEW